MNVRAKTRGHIPSRKHKMPFGIKPWRDVRKFSREAARAKVLAAQAQNARRNNIACVSPFTQNGRRNHQSKLEVGNSPSGV
jgi:hypothetical protein